MLMDVPLSSPMMLFILSKPSCPMSRLETAAVSLVQEGKLDHVDSEKALTLPARTEDRRAAETLHVKYKPYTSSINFTRQA